MRLLVVLMSLMACTARAGGDEFHVGDAPAGMAHAYVSRSGVWSIHHNPAGLGFTEQMEAGVYYESRFLLNALSLQSAAFALPTEKYGGFGVSYEGFGGPNYRDSRFTLAYGMKIGKYLSAGIGMGYRMIQVPGEYRNPGLVMAQAGVQYRVNEKLTLAAHAYNLTRSQVSEVENERSPLVLRIGGHYAFSEQFILAAEVEKDIDHTPVARIGAEYRPVPAFYIRAGASTGPILSTFGLGFTFSGFNLNLATTFHSQLGVTPQAGMTYQF